jgi:hypothetical protein
MRWLFFGWAIYGRDTFEAGEKMGKGKGKERKGEGGSGKVE